MLLNNAFRDTALNSRGSYLSPIFSSRLRSSSKTDLRVNSVLAMSDCGGFEVTLRSVKRCLKLDEEPVVADGLQSGESVKLCFLLELPPDHFSNITSNIRIRSSIDGLPLIDAFASESDELELSDGALDGDEGGCSTVDCEDKWNILWCCDECTFVWLALVRDTTF